MQIIYLKKHNEKIIFAAMILVLSVVFSDAIRFGKNSTQDTIMMKLNDFASFTLTTDITRLTGREKQMIPLMIEAAAIMDEMFWEEAYGDKDTLLDKLESDALKKLVMINYGPWERLNNNAPFITGTGPKLPGANYYPSDMTQDRKLPG
jgi:hypothetical protein